MVGVLDDPNLWRFPARVVDEYDGDTVRLDIDLGFGQSILAYHPFSGKLQLSARVIGMNAPELDPIDPVTRHKVPNPAGQAALAYAAQLLPRGRMVVVQSHLWDEFRARYDASITIPGVGDFAAAMIAAGHAEPYTD